MKDAFKELGDAIVQGLAQTDSENEIKTKDWYIGELIEENNELKQEIDKLRKEVERKSRSNQDKEEKLKHIKGKIEAYEFVIERIFGNG